MKKSELITPKEAGNLLGISAATVKNWIKLGKISATKNGDHFLLSKKDVLTLSYDLEKRDMLKSRRNKSRQTKNFIPKSYIKKTSPNYKIIQELLSSPDALNIDIFRILHYYSDLFLKENHIPDSIIAQLLDFFRIKIHDKSSLALLEDYPLSYIEGEDTLGMLYLSLRRLTEKKSTGSYYTPYNIVDLLLEKALFSYSNSVISSLSILDPACGSANFLIRLPKDVPLQNIYGNDIDETAICIARINLAIKFRISSEKDINTLFTNVRKLDFIKEKPLKAYDLIIGNPPWGYSYTPQEADEISGNFECFSKSGKPESFSLFIENSLSSDSVTFLLPETILGSDTHHGIREVIQKYSNVVTICYLGDVFDKVQCPCIILKLSRTHNDDTILTEFADSAITRSFYVPSSRISADSFHILADNEEYSIIQKMQACPHFTLKDKADFALGIVTGNNKKLILDSPVPGSEPIVKGTDIRKYAVNSPASYIVFDREALQQVAPVKFYRASEKLFYKFISSKLCFALDKKGLLSLNSANILIPRVEGYSAAYIMAVLNSSSMDFYYRHTCKNYKMLRSAIESLPIPCCDRGTMDKITALATKLHDDMEKHGKYDAEDEKRLDKMVANLYNLSAE